MDCIHSVIGEMGQKGENDMYVGKQWMAVRVKIHNVYWGVRLVIVHTFTIILTLLRF